MIFTQPIYFVFFGTVFTLYWLINRHELRKIILLCSSLFFYAWWDVRFLVLIIFVIGTTYGAAQYMRATKDQRKRKTAASLSIFAALGVLAIFKYFNFFMGSLGSILNLAGQDSLSVTLKILLPVGISFYTFQAISYTVDVYKNKLSSDVPLLDYATYVAFFPQLVAGPIVRAQTFLPQIARPRSFNWNMLRPYIFMFMIGYFKKACLADNIAIIIDPVYANPEFYSTATLYLTAFLYSVQIYCDFSGYTDMAIASAGLLGFRLRLNFMFPYFSQSIQLFWRRWHISLSSWLRDYLYIGLGGNRGGKTKMYRNLMLTMVLGGLWHGAGWNFIIWGFFHGAALILTRFIKLENIMPIPTSIRAGIGIALTFCFVSFLWIFFRAQTFAQSFHFVEGLFVARHGLTIDMDPILTITLIIATLFHAYNGMDHPAKYLGRLPGPAYSLGTGAMFALLLALTAAEQQAFIYFQF